MDDLISRQQAIDAFNTNVDELVVAGKENADSVEKYLNRVIDKIKELPSAHGTNLAEVGTDLISRQSAIDALKRKQDDGKGDLSRFYNTIIQHDIEAIMQLPSAQPKKEIAKRVLWTGWKGCRNTRYKCPNCKKPVKNDDIYCHRCGQKLMFPHISFTDYVPGEKQETIVRWDDE